MHLFTKVVISVVRSRTDENAEQWAVLSPQHAEYNNAITETLTIIRNEGGRIMAGEHLTVECPNMPAATFELLQKRYERRVANKEGACVDEKAPDMRVHYTMHFEMMFIGLMLLT